MFIVLLQIAAIAAFIWSLYNFYRVWSRSAVPTPIRPTSSTNRTPLAGSLKSGSAAHDARAAAPTAKLSMVDSAIARSEQPTEDDDAMQGLFNNKDKGKDTATKALDPATEAARKASRQEQLGFHHSIPAVAPAADTDASATAALAAKLAQSGATKGQDLNSILERIDLFLADDENKAPTEPATEKLPGAKTDLLPAQDAQSNISGALTPQKKPDAETAKGATPPPWARPDAVDRDVSKDDDGEQQRLF
jgi:hypothetical protein